MKAVVVTKRKVNDQQMCKNQPFILRVILSEIILSCIKPQEM